MQRNQYQYQYQYPPRAMDSGSKAMALADSFASPPRPRTRLSMSPTPSPNPNSDSPFSTIAKARDDRKNSPSYSYWRQVTRYFYRWKADGVQLKEGNKINCQAWAQCWRHLPRLPPYGMMSLNVFVALGGSFSDWAEMHVTYYKTDKSLTDLMRADKTGQQYIANWREVWEKRGHVKHAYSRVGVKKRTFSQSGGAVTVPSSKKRKVESVESVESVDHALQMAIDASLDPSFGLPPDLSGFHQHNGEYGQYNNDNRNHNSSHNHNHNSNSNHNSSHSHNHNHSYHSPSLFSSCQSLYSGLSPSGADIPCMESGNDDDAAHAHQVSVHPLQVLNQQRGFEAKPGSKAAEVKPQKTDSVREKPKDKKRTVRAKPTAFVKLKENYNALLKGTAHEKMPLKYRLIIGVAFVDAICDDEEYKLFPLSNKQAMIQALVDSFGGEKKQYVFTAVNMDGLVQKIDCEWRADATLKDIIKQNPSDQGKAAIRSSIMNKFKQAMKSIMDD